MRFRSACRWWRADHYRQPQLARHCGCATPFALEHLSPAGGVFIYLISAYAETNRTPFDLPEAESELVAGYHTEYSAMKFAMFFMAEYANMVTVACLATLLFFGAGLARCSDRRSCK